MEPAIVEPERSNDLEPRGEEVICNTNAAPDSNPRMELHEPEKTWAKNIKEMVEADPALDNLSDYWYAALALVDHGEHGESLKRVQALQNFREEYGVRHEISEAMEYFRKMMKLFPRHYLSYDFLNPGSDYDPADRENDMGGHYVMAVDLTGLYMKDFVGNPEAMHIWCVAAYYLITALNPDLEAVRQGVYMLAECEGFDWKRNFDVGCKRKLWGDLVTVYPFNINRVKHYHNGLFLNLLMSMAKRFIPRDVQETFEFGCKNATEDGHQRLDDMYLQPTVEAAQEKMLGRLKAGMERRFNHEKTFRL